MMLAKKATLGLVKKEITWNKDYDVIIFPHDITNQTLLQMKLYCRFGHMTKIW